MIRIDEVIRLGKRCGVPGLAVAAPRGSGEEDER
jgi:hypothetical protein